MSGGFSTSNLFDNDSEVGETTVGYADTIKLFNFMSFVSYKADLKGSEKENLRLVLSLIAEEIIGGDYIKLALEYFYKSNEQLYLSYTKDKNNILLEELARCNELVTEANPDFNFRKEVLVLVLTLSSEPVYRTAKGVAGTILEYMFDEKDFGLMSDEEKAGKYFSVNSVKGLTFQEYKNKFY